jgi:hypothetical protein
MQISGLNRTRFDLAVYASQWRSPDTTQDSLPAAGPALPDGIHTRRVPTKGFKQCYPPFPSFLALCQAWFLVFRRGLVAGGFAGRVGLGGCPPKPPTDPGSQSYRTRFFVS